jgi:hypothetical protein
VARAKPTAAPAAPPPAPPPRAVPSLDERFAETVEARIKEETEPDRPPLPAFPLWQGVYTYPFSLNALGRWIMLGVGFTIVAMLAAALHYCIHLYQTTILARLISYAIILIVKAFMLDLIFTLSFAASYFLAVLENSAYGGDKTDWPGEMLMERLGRVVYLFWIVVVGAVPVMLLGIPLSELIDSEFAWTVLIIPAVIIFPLPLLNSLANGSAWLVWNADLMRSLFRKPLMLVSLWVGSAALALPCALLVYFVAIDMDFEDTSLNFALTPVAGFVWSAAVFIYGRLLGRVVLLATEGEGKKRKKRKKRKKVVPPPADAVPDAPLI